MKNKKLMSILLVGAILGSTLGAATVSAADKTSVSLWTWSPITRTAEKMIAAFEKANPDITVDYTNITTTRNICRHFPQHLHLTTFRTL